jgi:hypothetical protein
VLAQLGDASQRCENGLRDVPKDILDVFLDEQRKLGTDTTLPVCVLDQLTFAPGESCKNDPRRGWCYVENDGARRPAQKCNQAIAFSAPARDLRGARFTLQCINQLDAR